MKKSNCVITNNNLERLDQREERELLPHMSDRRSQVRESIKLCYMLKKQYLNMLDLRKFGLVWQAESPVRVPRVRSHCAQENHPGGRGKTIPSSYSASCGQMLFQCCGSGSGSAWIRVNLVTWIRIRIRICICIK